MAVPPRTRPAGPAPAHGRPALAAAELGAHGPRTDDSRTGGPHAVVTVGGAPLPVRAVLTDLDGTLLDTERAWLAALDEWLHAQGVTDTAELLEACRGATEEVACEVLVAGVHAAHLAGVERSARDTPRESTTSLHPRGTEPTYLDASSLLTDLLATIDGLDLSPGARWLPGAADLVDAVRDAGVPLALVTSSTRRWVDALAPALDPSLFDVVVTADDVAHHKPHPSPYLRAAELLGVPATECLALEDSRPGSTAALAAGCHVVAVGDAHGLERAARVSVVGALTELSLAR